MRNTTCAKLDRTFIDRWSPRAFLPDKLSHEDLMTLFEAARWSPSCFNEQPWHFVYAVADEDLARFQSVLTDKNRSWASRAPVLIIAFSRPRFRKNDKPNRWADFDAGAAWMALNLQAHRLGLHCHAMGGFDEDMAYEATGLDRDQYKALCVIAVGRRADADVLPEDLRAREAPSDRSPLDGMITEGRMPG
ncbi:nitroreductase [Thioalkalivibrio sulfidiphilus HL-EbGr7]|uniref:Nitroreductase n=1 Tax=Thioalkalivibrio sulfidiphilus (strain HL-EbGR7) TaxID=396588 RepID=B8GUA5_THISH|nr:nitroreductase family protein [Thioalkalivibrio sulfidiphilus]ACL71388.1 nitroreductase [Thioalkalivibrio sulfidiphilus HL-EbGr7]